MAERWIKLRRVTHLREPDSEIIAVLSTARAEGVPIPQSCKLAGISVAVYYRWKAEAGEGVNGLIQEFGEKVLIYDRMGQLAPEAPGTRDGAHFAKWCEGKVKGTKPLLLDSGEIFCPEPWEVRPVDDFLSGDFKLVLMVVGESNGKTSLTAAIILYLLEHQLTPEIPIGSATTTQAETLYRQIEGFIHRSGKAADFKMAPGLRRIDSRRTRGHTRVYPHNEKTGDGVIPSAWALDELHLHKDLRLLRVWKGKYRKRGGVGIAISTAGEPSSEFEELRSRILNHGTVTDTAGRKDQYKRVIDGDTVLHDWAVRDQRDIDDFEVVAEANPLAAITAEELAAKRAEPEMTDEHWQRRTCNIPTRVGGTGVSAAEWDSMRETGLKPKPGVWGLGFVDLGWKIDTTAVGVLLWESEVRRPIVGVRVLEPPVDEDDVVRAIVALQREYEPEGWVYDPNAGGQQMVQQLEKGTHEGQEGVELVFIEHSQSNAPMALAAQRFDEAVRNGWFVHDGNRVMRAHVLNAIRKPIGQEKHRYDRPADAKGNRRAQYPIDVLTGVLMANSTAVAIQTGPQPEAESWVL